MKASASLLILFLALLLPASLHAASLELSAATLSPGDDQTLEAQIDASDADVYLILSSTNGTLRTLKSDGDFAAPGFAVPFAATVSLSEKTAIHTWRVTGLAPATYGWILVAVRPGGSLDADADRLEIASAEFAVTPSTDALFAELKEGHGGREPGAPAARRGRAAGVAGFGAVAGGGFAGETASDAPAEMAESAASAETFGFAPASEKLLIDESESLRSVRPARDSSGPVPSRPSVAPPAPPAPPAVAAPALPPLASPEPSPAPAPKVAAKPKAMPKKSLARDYRADTGRARWEGKAKGGAKDAAKFERREVAGAKKGDAFFEDGADKELDKDELAAAKNAIAKAKALTAGITDDNDNFDDFLKFLQDRNRNSVMAMDISQRRFITVVDADGKHVSNADVTVSYEKDGQDQIVFTGRTLANGQTLFHPSAIPDIEGKTTFTIEVAKGLIRSERTVEVDVKKDEKLKNIFSITKVPKPMPVPNMPLPPCCPIMKCGVVAEDAAPAAERKRLDLRDNWAAAGARAAAAKPAPIKAEAKNWLPGKFAPAAPGSWTARALDLGEAREAAAKVGGDWVINLPAAVTPGQPKIDLVFQIDTTGSMRDEIAAVQATLQSVARRIDAMEPQPLVRWGLVLYGDRGDAYVVRRYRFTEDVDEMHKWILNMQMTGGGDTPESALEALNASINEMQWDTGDAIRLVFGIADAPPHLDYNRDYTYIDKMKEAVAKGIKVIPTAASGLDKTGEYIFRQWAQATMGKFLFITYGAGTPAGGPAGKSPHEVAQPEKKNNLDDIIVRAVADELDAWRTPVFAEAGAKEKLK